MTGDLRLGRWQDVLDGETCDLCLFDAPYGARTHAGHDAMSGTAAMRPIDYTCITPVDVAEIVGSWSPRTRGWLNTITSHDLIQAWERELDAAGRYVFAPLPIIDRGSRVRLQGDGPSSWTVFMVCSRPRTAEMSKWGTLPGVYERSQGDERGQRMGGKPLGVMRAIVRDYSRPGDVVCDPFAGHATTILAALIEGRGGIGAEVDADAHAAGVERLARGYTPDMFSGVGAA